MPHLFLTSNDCSEHGVFFIKYCSVLLQALSIETDEDLLFSIYDLIQVPGSTWQTGAEEQVDLALYGCAMLTSARQCVAGKRRDNSRANEYDPRTGLIFRSSRASTHQSLIIIRTL